MASATKDLCVITFDERTNREGFRRRILNAVEEGIYAFKFKLSFGMGKDCRHFETKIAVHPDSDTESVIYMADCHYDRYSNIIAALIVNPKADVADRIA